MKYIMKRQSVTLRENHALIKLSTNYSVHIDELTEKILNDLTSIGCLYDIPEECGETIENLLIENDYTLEQFSVKSFQMSSPTVLSILKGLQIWGIHNDCEDCGCEMIEKEDEKECSNPVCGCSINTNYAIDPDWYRDDCKIDYTYSLN